MSRKEKRSYTKKIESRLKRIEQKGFTEKEQEQHNSYGYDCKVLLPNGKEKHYPSLAKATRDLGIDCSYARTTTQQGRKYKGYQVFILSEPTVDCRSFKDQA